MASYLNMREKMAQIQIVEYNLLQLSPLVEMDPLEYEIELIANAKII